VFQGRRSVRLLVFTGSNKKGRCFICLEEKGENLMSAMRWFKERLVNGTWRYRLYIRKGVFLNQSIFFIDKDKYQNAHKYEIYGSGMSERGFAKQLGGFDYLKDAKARATELYLKEKNDEPHHEHHA
jgi:hypothetical protein